MYLILGQRSLDAGYGRWMLMVCNEYNDDNDDDGDDCDYAIRPMDVFEITNSGHNWMVSESFDVPIKSRSRPVRSLKSLGNVTTLPTP